MTEHVHECKYQLRQTLTYRRFVCSGCSNIISIADAEEILNEYETLKAATERLSAERVKAILEDRKLYSQDILALYEYAKTLEGKDDA